MIGSELGPIERPVDAVVKRLAREWLGAGMATLSWGVERFGLHSATLIRQYAGR